MDTSATVKTDRRGVISILAGILGGLLFSRPKRLRATAPEFKQILSTIEMEVLENSRPKRHPAISWHNHGDKTILSWKGRGQQRPKTALNRVGMIIWEGCDGDNTVREIARFLEQSYKVSPGRAYVDCLTFLAALFKKGMIQI